MSQKQFESYEKEASMVTGESSMESESKYIIAADRREAADKLPCVACVSCSDFSAELCIVS